MNSILMKRFTTKAGVKLTNVCKTLIQDIKQAGTYKQEKNIESPQGVEIMVNGKKMLTYSRREIALKKSKIEPG